MDRAVCPTPMKIYSGNQWTIFFLKRDETNRQATMEGQILRKARSLGEPVWFYFTLFLN